MSAERFDQVEDKRLLVVVVGVRDPDIRVKTWDDENSYIRVSSTSHNLVIFVPFCHHVLNRQSVSGVLNTACFANIDS